MPFIKIYDNLFRLIYSKLPVLSAVDEATGSRSRMSDLAAITHAAYRLDALQSVRHAVELHLLRLGQSLWQTISEAPETWAHLGIVLQSSAIYREAMCHLVGAMDIENMVDLGTIDRLPSASIIHKVIHEKRARLHELKMSIERRLIDFYPQAMLHPLEEGKAVPIRSVYSDDIYLWQALVLARQWIMSCYLSNRHHKAADGGVEFYRKIGHGEDAYLREEALADWHENFAMSLKGKKVLLLALEHVKSELRVVVQDLLVDRTSVYKGPSLLPFPYLTCTTFSDDELPWSEDAGFGQHPIYTWGASLLDAKGRRRQQKRLGAATIDDSQKKNLG